MGLRNQEKNREYQRLWRKKRRDAFFAGKSCKKCGSTENLELDHIDRKKKVDHKIWSWTKEKMEAEAKKCQILCKKHHIEKTSRERRGHLRHGMLTLYQHYGCRCALCRETKRLSDYKYRHK